MGPREGEGTSLGREVGVCLRALSRSGCPWCGLSLGAFSHLWDSGDSNGCEPASWGVVGERSYPLSSEGSL